MTYELLTAALEELDNLNELRTFCDRYLATQDLEELALALTQP